MFATNRIVKSRSDLPIFLVRVYFHDILVDHLNVNRSEIRNINKYGKHILSALPRNQIIENCQILQKFDVDIYPLKHFAGCLRLSDNLLNHRICLLKEMGVQKVNTLHICRLRSFMVRSAGEFKNLTGIPKEQSIVRNMLSQFEEIDSSSVELLDDTLLLYHHYKQSLLYVLSQLCNISKKDDTYKNIKYASLQMIVQAWNTLVNDIGLNQDFVEKHFYLTEFSQDNLLSVFNSFKNVYIGGMEFSQFIRRRPEILSFDVNNTKELLASFKLYGINSDQVQRCPEIFCLKNSVFKQRMEEFFADPYFKIWSEHPRILHLICRKNSVTNRAEFLKLMNRLDRTTVCKFIASESEFLRYIQGYSWNPQFRKDLQYILCKELGKDKKDIIKLLIRHPGWRNASITNMNSILYYLKKYFTVNDICENIQIVLYPRKVVVRTLINLYRMYSQRDSYQFTRTQYLALCVYTLEKKSYFSGDGIWDSDEPIELDKPTLDKFEVSEECVKECHSELLYISNVPYMMRSEEIYEYI